MWDASQPLERNRGSHAQARSAGNCFPPARDSHGENIMTIFRGARAGLIASGVLMLGLSCFPAAVSHAASLNHPVMLVNDKTGKCLTIAGGETTANNVDAVQFNCDSDPSRSWMLREMDG